MTSEPLTELLILAGLACVLGVTVVAYTRTLIEMVRERQWEFAFLSIGGGLILAGALVANLGGPR